MVEPKKGLIVDTLTRVGQSAQTRFLVLDFRMALTSATIFSCCFFFAPFAGGIVSGKVSNNWKATEF